MERKITRYEAPGIVLAKTESGEKKKYDPDLLHTPFLVEKAYKPGDTIKIELEFNEYFSDEDKVVWEVGTKDIPGNNIFEYTFSEKDIGKNFRIGCKVTSKKEWHRYNNHDHSINILINVIP